MSFVKQAQVVDAHSGVEVAIDTLAPASNRYVVTCPCHNPDQNFDGRADFTGATLEEAIDAWYDHFLEELAR